MKTYTVSELDGVLLDAAVARAQGYQYRIDDSPLGRDAVLARTNWPRTDLQIFGPSTYWEDAGPILENNDWCLPRVNQDIFNTEQGRYAASTLGGKWYYGPTPLVAAMRAFVASKLGEELEF